MLSTRESNDTPTLSDIDTSATVWTTVRDALRGSDVDYTTAPVGRAVLLLAIPMALELVLESVFAVVDVFFVSRLGADAVAVVGLTESLLTIMYAVMSGLAIGVTAVVARRIGERDRDGAARAATQAIALVLAIALPVGIGGVAFARDLLAAMGAAPDVLAHVSYARIVFGCNVVILMLFSLNAVFRGAGDATTAMRVLWVANACNIVLDPCFIFGLGPFPRLGVTGAAVATTTGRTVGVLLQFWVLCRGTDRIAITRRHLRFSPSVMATMVRLSGSAIIQSLIVTTSWVALIRVLAGFGSSALAGYTIAIRIVLFALLPAWGLANAAATLVGQNLGAGRLDRAEAAVWRACRYNVVFFAVLGALFLALARPLVAVFTSDPAVAPIASRGLQIIASGFLFYAYGTVITQSFNGAGDTWTPTVINIVGFWIMGVPIAHALAWRFGWGPSGVFASIAIAFSATALAGSVVFRRGRWKAATV